MQSRTHGIGHSHSRTARIPLIGERASHPRRVHLGCGTVLPNTTRKAKTMESDKIKTQIRQLLNLANDAGATPAERERAEERAAKLVHRHDLDMAELLQPEALREKFVTLKMNLPVGNVSARLIANAAAKRADCNFHYVAGKGYCVGYYFGTDAATSLAQALTERWLGQLEYDVRHAHRMGQIVGKAESTSFRKGWAFRVDNRVAELMAQINRDEAREVGTALVLVKTRESEYQAKYRPRTVRVNSGSSRYAAGLGGEAGSRADLSAGGIHGASGKALVR